jgi:hypothetical protein
MSLATLSNSYSTLDELLIEIPDNTSNAINAKDIRDSIFTLWDRVNIVQTVASQSASASSFYVNSTPTPVTIGGIAAGSTFSVPQTMQQMFDKLLYPYISPACSISGGGSREFGSGISVALSWSVTRHTNPITSLIVNSVVKVPTGNNQSSLVPDVALSVQNVNTTFSMTAGDGVSVASSSTTVSWFNARYWGVSATFGPITSPTILALNGAGVGSGKELASSRVQTRNGINGGGEYLVFAWPTSFGTPAFVINGLPNTAFTKVDSGYSFVNAYGYTTAYDVWMSNTVQNSPISLFQIN